jgi:hypothetical protein
VAGGIDKSELRKVFKEADCPIHHPKKQSTKADASFKRSRTRATENKHYGIVYVVERKTKPGKQFAYLKFIPAKDLRLRHPHPLHHPIHTGIGYHRRDKAQLPKAEGN